ncbi:hypothetical protein ACXR0O_09100 [Verrucomicrobiota bacterium sgz303538]
MRKPFKAKKLDQIFTEQRNPWFLHELNGFICHKKWDLSQQLNDVETTFYLIKRFGSAIVGDGWDSVFVQTYTYSELQRIIDTFRQDISLPDFADKLEAGRAIYYLGRTDLDSPDEILVNGSVFAHLTRAQRKKLDALGDGIDKEGGELAQLEPLLAKWCRDHRDGFVEPRD